MATPKTPEEIRKAMQEIILNKGHIAPWMTFKQPPKGPHHGQHRRTSPKAHGNSASQSGPRDDRADALAYATVRTGLPSASWRTINAGTIQNPGAGVTPNLTVADLQQAMQYLAAYGTAGWTLSFDVAKSPAPIPYAGILTGEIIGHRAWYVTSSGFLRSLAHGFIWKPGETVTGDLNERVGGTARPIYGGVYSFKAKDLDDDTQLELAYYRTWDMTFPAMAVGTVELWGEVVEHDFGYRASHAKVKSIDHVAGQADIEALRERYGV